MGRHQRALIELPLAGSPRCGAPGGAGLFGPGWATYLQVYGDLLVRTNNWDSADLDRFCNADAVRDLGRWADELRDVGTLKALEEAIPRSWLECAAVGTAEECARKVRHQFDLGVDGVIMHGATPTELAPIVHSYQNQFIPPITTANRH